jgi:hypothetical protein
LVHSRWFRPLPFRELSLAVPVIAVYRNSVVS